MTSDPGHAPGIQAAPGGDAKSRLRGRMGTHAVYYLSGEIGSRLLTFAVLVAVANLIAPEQFGLASLYFGLANLTAIVLALGLPNSIVRYFFQPIPFSSVLGSIGGLILIASVIVLALLGLAARPVAAFLSIPIPLLAAVAIGGVAIAYRSAWTASLRARGRSRAYAAGVLGEPAIALAIILAWLGSGRNVDHLVVAYSLAVAAALVAIVGLWDWARDPGLAIDTAVARDLLLFSAPLIFHAFAMYALSTYDQVIINQTLGSAEAGRYAFAYRWGMAMVALTAAFGSLWNPRFQELIRSEAGRSTLNRLAMRTLGPLVAAGVVLMLVLPFAARPFAPLEFRGALVLTSIVTYGYLWYALYSAVIGYAIAFRRTSRIAIGSIAVVAINIAANYVLIPRFGIFVAALTTVASYAMLFGIQWWLVRDVALDIRYGRLAAGVAVLGLVPVLVTQLA